ncbi:Cytochrome P450 monooxygenase PikC [Streptomyces sp. RB5]|uniref:Cytochrome P450 monooxygenase PikC n=1 Tax=Streptomyces smaragdinus TaxID=2585196 RepID=A0A7K0CNG4_9ACTN|nr:cytochrome P450 [Streptomyces smaragdinus]MQY15025.1 Cytochrome P450 monooxygenase PikC [Streptomyces smaragdinus]
MTVPDRFALYGEAFAADPHGTYTRMRRAYGPLVPVELAPGVPATLVIGYAQALRILNDPLRFPADPREWQKGVDPTTPILPMTQWRPQALRSAGTDHTRYRSVNVAGINTIDQHALRGLVERSAQETVAGFRADGRADLRAQYAKPMVFQVLGTVLGCPDELLVRIADGMARIFDAISPEDSGHGAMILHEALGEHVTLRRKEPGEDMTSVMLAHPTALTDEEMIHQVITLFGAGLEPLANLITNTQLKILTDEEFSDSLHAGRRTVRDALDTVLYTDPPMAAYCLSYPPYPVDVDGVLLPAHQPVMISMAGCNNDPELTRGVSPEAMTGNRAHLAWSTGPHACPARSHAYLIAETAVSHLLDAIPEMDLAVPADELHWRPGPFHRALRELPVVF